ncbi:MAG: hypothetical protein Q8R12_04740, partial [bacterium]|nr:hypothetical protein [bacterium]
KPRQEGDRIVFAGIVPGGYSEERGLLFSLVFTTRQEGSGVIELRKAEAFYNDGKGTPASLTVFQLAFAIGKEGIAVPIPPPEDREPPETFKPLVGSDPALFQGKPFLAFSAKDKKSGIDRYEVKETRNKTQGMFKSWKTAESPYVLRDQELRSFIFVKAVDKAGNKRIMRVAPQHPLSWYEMYEIWSIIIAGLVVIYVIRKFLWNRNTK